MQLLYEILPVFLFFLAFKFYGMYVATLVGIIATFLQVLITRLLQKKWDRKQLITLSVFVIFGGLTLYFHNPIFVKWKPTIVFWIFAGVIVVTHFFAQKPLMQRLMENVLQPSGSIPRQVWQRLNGMWAIFFICLGGVNLYIAYHYSNDAWVNFKFYGLTGALFGFSIIQTLYLMRYLPSTEK